MNNNLQKQQATRFYELDLLRFFAAMGVVLFHYVFLDVIENKSAPDFPILGEIFKYGYFGVEFFFMISGFVILLTAQNKNWQGFIVSRISRLYPAFWIAVTVTSIAILLLKSGKIELSLSQYLLNLTMIPEYMGTLDIDSVYWSLQVEIKFYFLVFIVLFFNKLRYIEYILFGWLIVAVLEQLNVSNVITRAIFMPQYSPYFGAGALFYIIKTKGWNLQRVIFLIIAFVLSMIISLKNGEIQVENYHIYFSPYVLASLLCLYFLIFAFIISENKPEILNSKVRTFFIALGGISYPLYLLHNKIGELLFIKLSFIENRYLLLLTIVSIVMTLSFVLYRHIERKFAFSIRRSLKAHVLSAAN